MNDRKRSWRRRLSTTLGIVASFGWLGAPPSAAQAQESSVPRAEATLEGLGAGPLWLTAQTGATRQLVYPPLEGNADAPLVMMLHGMCDSPQNECPWFAGAASKNNWLLCPQASVRCAGGGTMWPGDISTRISLTETFLHSFESHYPSTTRDPTNKYLVGFSQGAYMAAQLAIQSGSSWKGLILIGARVRLDTARLAQNGIRRVLLASGDFDMVRDDMRKEAGRAEGRHGIEVRYESLGRVGHGFAPDMDGWMGRALAWVTSRPQASNSDIAPGSAGR